MATYIKFLGTQLNRPSCLSRTESLLFMLDVSEGEEGFTPTHWVFKTCSWLEPVPRCQHSLSTDDLATVPSIPVGPSVNKVLSYIRLLGLKASFESRALKYKYTGEPLLHTPKLFGLSKTVN